MSYFHPLFYLPIFQLKLQLCHLCKDDFGGVEIQAATSFFEREEQSSKELSLCDTTTAFAFAR